MGSDKALRQRMDQQVQRIRKAREEAVGRLNGLSGGDPEIAHAKADNVLLEFLRAMGHSDVADAYEQSRERVGFWYA